MSNRTGLENHRPVRLCYVLINALLSRNPLGKPQVPLFAFLQLSAGVLGILGDSVGAIVSRKFNGIFSELTHYLFSATFLVNYSRLSL